MNKKDAKTAIIDAAETLFLKHGFSHVSVDEICKYAGVSRKTFYVYFANKDALTIELLDKINESFFSDFLYIMNSAISFTDKMMKVIEIKLSLSKQLSMDFVTDLTSSKKVLEYYRKMANENIAIARSFLLQAQKKGEIRNELDIDFIMAMLNNQMDLYEKQEFRSMFKDGESMMKQMTEMFLYGIVENRV